MTDSPTLIPAAELVLRSKRRPLPNESAEHRAARDALLVEEIELRRHLARVAAQRRALPPGGEVTHDYRFVGAGGEVGFAELFGGHDTLFVYDVHRDGGELGPRGAAPRAAHRLRDCDTIRHFWSVEGGPEIADPGQGPHGAPDPNPLWNLLDLTPGGRGTDWYPGLRYDD